MVADPGGVDPSLEEKNPDFGFDRQKAGSGSNREENTTSVYKYWKKSSILAWLLNILYLRERERKNKEKRRRGYLVDNLQNNFVY